MNSKFHSLTKDCLLLAALALLLAGGCTKDVDNIKLPTTDPKLVVGCFVSPQASLIAVTLTRSNPIFGPSHSNTNSSAVEDATVILTDGTNSVNIPYNNGNSQYEMSTAAFPIVAGQTYSLSVSTPKGENVSGSCTVPASSINALTVDFTDTISTNSKKITVHWQDISGEVNFYRVIGQLVSLDTFNTLDTTFDYMYGGNLFNDHDKDGNEMYAKLEGYPSWGPDLKLIAYDVYMLNIDAEYYKYQNSLDHYTYNDPFSEPSPLYTNIKGGLGVFGAYQQLRVRFP